MYWPAIAICGLLAASLWMVAAVILGCRLAVLMSRLGVVE